MFDAYHKWLGIPKDQRPPTHYQLLGLAPEEQDREVIEEAAIRQSTHLRAYQIGAHATDCTRLLNEIAQARGVLLNPAKRAEYDAQLARRTAAARTAITARPLPNAPEDSFAELGAPVIAAPPAPRRRSKLDIAKPRGLSPGLIWGLVIGGGGLMAALVLIAVIASQRAVLVEEDAVVRAKHEVARLKKAPKAQDNGPLVEDPRVANPAPIRPMPPNPAPPPPAKPLLPLPPLPGPVPLPAEGGLRVVAVDPAATIDVDANPVAWEGPKLRGELAKELGHATALAWSGNGRWLATGHNLRVRVQDLHSGAVVLDQGMQRSVVLLHFSPDGKYLLHALHDQPIVHVWEMPTGREVRQFVFDRTPKAVALLPNGRLLATMSPKRKFENGRMNVLAPGWLRVFDAQTGQAVHTSEDLQYEPWNVRVSDDGRQAAWQVMEANHLARIWDLRTGAVTFNQQLKWGAVASPDMRQFACKANDLRGLEIWDVATGAVRQNIRYDVPVGRMTELAWNGRTALGMHHHLIQVFDIPTNKSVGLLQGHEAGVRWLEIARDGATAISADQQGTLRVWSLPDDLTHLKRVPMVRHSAHWNPNVNMARVVPPALALAPDGQHALLADFGIAWWDLAGGRLGRTLTPRQPPPPGQPIYACAISPDGQWGVASTAADGQIYWFNVNTGEQVAVLEDFTTPVGALAFTPDGRYLLAGGGRFEIKNGRAVGHECGLHVYDVATRKLVTTLEGHTNRIETLAVSADSKLAYTASGDPSVRVWDLENLRAARVLPGARYPVSRLALAPDGRTMACLSLGNPMVVRDTSTGAIVQHNKEVPILVTCVAYSADGKFLALGDLETHIHLLDAKTGERLAVMEGTINMTHQLAFDRRQPILYATSYDGLRRWQLPAEVVAAP
jgi:WD40 repeat protein